MVSLKPGPAPRLHGVAKARPSHALQGGAINRDRNVCISQNSCTHTHTHRRFTINGKLRDEFNNGNGQDIARAAYSVINAIQGFTPALQLQAVSMVFLAILESFKDRVRPAYLLGTVSRILDHDGQHSTFLAMASYIKAEIAGDGYGRDCEARLQIQR